MDKVWFRRKGFVAALLNVRTKATAHPSVLSSQFFSFPYRFYICVCVCVCIWLLLISPAVHIWKTEMLSENPFNVWKASPQVHTLPQNISYFICSVMQNVLASRKWMINYIQLMENKDGPTGLRICVSFLISSVFLILVV